MMRGEPNDALAQRLGHELPRRGNPGDELDREELGFIGEAVGIDVGVAAAHLVHLAPHEFDPRSDRRPVETDGGSGTAGGHWDDEIFEDEIMTGFISDENYVSSMTVASLEDLGYDTVWDASDPSAPIPQPEDLLV